MAKPDLTRNERTVRAVSVFLAFTNCVLLSYWMSRNVMIATRVQVDLKQMSDDEREEYETHRRVWMYNSGSTPDHTKSSLFVTISVMDSTILESLHAGTYGRLKTIERIIPIAHLLAFAVFLVTVFRGIQLGIRALFPADADPDDTD